MNGPRTTRRCKDFPDVLVSDAEALEIGLRTVLDEDEACDAAMRVLELGWRQSRAALTALEEIKGFASDPFVSEPVALRACLLEAYEALGLPGPEDSPEREIARAVIAEMDGTPAAHPCQRCGSEEWTDVDYSGCSDCRERTDDDDPDDGYVHGSVA